MAAGLSALQQSVPAGIPVVDVAGLYSSDPVAQKAAAARIGAACDDIGFFYAVNHNVPVEIIDRAVAMADTFFHLPEQERLKVKADSNNRGYRDVWDSVHRNGKTNARDSFDLGFPVTEDDPEVKAGTPLYAPNNWPELPGFREAIETYYGETYKLGMKILEGFALYLGQPVDFFTRHFTKPVADMVINHYLGNAGLHISDQASGPHTDHGIVTILWQDSLGGLEVMGKDGNWMQAAPLRGSFVINIGELMKRWTNGRFKATVHRVVHLRDMPRYSMPLFCNPNFRTIVDPRDLGVPESEVQYPPVQSGEFLLSRFKATRKLWGAEKRSMVSNDDKLIEAAAQ
ncbi:Isopenicillin N synthase [Enhydrobacter aerosaccus]|uniref:2-oxoglutarate-dependent ethylene/succinate-forming enzyme n=1 Tax=Enhydrobacter aerosaccus TaxID=225324 RepID=A0A1T4SWR0_9HYPH|nr:2-oxoglutarate and iron-dependent oxygenase domain-containing protein [Enhydrobacter aerosaccus]SKA32586.1 Isopenicillin N synthase [Enhydrobacter aerosaccus]